MSLTPEEIAATISQFASTQQDLAKFLLAAIPTNLDSRITAINERVQRVHTHLAKALAPSITALSKAVKDAQKGETPGTVPTEAEIDTILAPFEALIPSE